MNTAQGFSVSYKDKLLYSKYAPNKAILQTVTSLNLLPGTLILCLSPVLPYGLLELASKLPKDSLMLGIEADLNLYDFIIDYFSNNPKTEIYAPSNRSSENSISSDWQKLLKTEKFTFISRNESFNLPVILNKKRYITENGFSFPIAGTFRRVICINCSAGTQFCSSFYLQLEQACTNAIMTFWANRVTLTKLGHNYSKNFFKNLKLFPQTEPIQNYFNSVYKSIIVFGAGQSIDKGIKQIKNHNQEYYILCADTALQPLLKNGITPNGVFIEEAQQIITKAFIGTLNSSTHIFAGLSSISSLAHSFSLKNISFFTTLYSDADFIHKMQDSNILPPSNDPFGSVGLTAVYYALKFRKNDEVPVFIYGLDFSYSAGITHGKDTPAHTNRLISTNRLIPVQNYGSAFSAATKTTTDKNGLKIFTSHILSSYANTFNSLFQNEKNLFDSGETGLKLAIPTATPSYINMQSKTDIRVKPEYDTTQSEYDIARKSTDLVQFFKNEKAALTKLKDILTGKITLSEKERNTIIMELINQREYLYLHFPDGWKASTDISFLKRVRAEIEIFLKIFKDEK